MDSCRRIPDQDRRLRRRIIHSLVCVPDPFDGYVRRGHGVVRRHEEGL